MEFLASPELWAALFTLTALEIVLGIDNVIFLAIIAGRLPPETQALARTLGLAGALLTRIALLLSLAWLAGATTALFTLRGLAISGRDLVLFFGGSFLLYKAGVEIREMLRVAGSGGHARPKRAVPSLTSAIAQIMVLDIVFSLDSVITAVGMTTHLPVMIAAITIAIITMMFFSGPLAAFVDRHPTVKMLALAFLLMIGAVLIADGLHFHIPKAYVYVAMGFSVAVELLNLRLRHKLASPSPTADDP